jgi:ribonuclease VapC
MVLDTSAIVAILAGEPEQDEFLRKMAAAERLYLSAVSLVEVAAVLMHRGGVDIEHSLDPFLSRAGVEVMPVDEVQAMVARDAYRRYGKGRHRARLNLGDCFAYALAVRTGEALLFKGDDFGWTDVAVG